MRKALRTTEAEREIKRETSKDTEAEWQRVAKSTYTYKCTTDANFISHCNFATTDLSVCGLSEKSDANKINNEGENRTIKSSRCVWYINLCSFGLYLKFTS